MSSELRDKISRIEDPKEVEQLREQITTLEQLLEVYEQETLNKSAKLEQALSQLREHTQQLTHAESTLSALKSMLESIGDAVVVTDQQGKFMFLNPAAETILGIHATNSCLKDWATSWSQDSGVQLPNQQAPYPIEEFPIARAIRGEAVDATEMFVRSSEAAVGNWLSVTARPLLDQQGDIQGGIAVFHTITSLKQTEGALRQSEARSREQADQLQQALHKLQKTQAHLVQTEKMSSLGQLVAGVAHEINNPINFVYGNISPAKQYVQDLLRLIHLYQKHYPDPVSEIQAEIQAIDLDFLQEDLPNLLQSIKIGAERVRQIVLSLRNFSRLDEAEMKRVDIHEGLESTLLILQKRLQSKQNLPEIQVVRRYGNLPTIECYASQLNQVFMNILANAIDAVETKSQQLFNQSRLEASTFIPAITITTKQQNGFVVIHIADNGSGMTAEVKKRLFDPFFTTKPIGQGTGLGLSISYEIVTKKHNGVLKCDSDLDQGTDFWIKIPINL